ncbi:MAG: cadherin domain-containing protein [Planctomycetaceae bacterium]
MFLKSWIQSLANRMVSNRSRRRFGLPALNRYQTRRIPVASMFIACPSLETLEDRKLLTNSPIFTASGPFSVSENAANSASVGDVDANDGDGGGADAGITYSITAGNGTGAFAINTSTGEITVADATQLDFEVTASYALTVNASDGTDTDSTATVTINLTDEAPVIDDQTFSVSENAITAAAVGTVVNTGDNDSVMYSITVGNAAGVFAINAATGAITIADATLLDFEVTPSYALTVQATDGVNSDSATITIDVTNQAPVIDNQTFSVSENAITAAAVGTIVNTGDNDSVMYSITVGNAAGVFAINASTGAITIADATLLDFEVTPSYALTVQATDGVNSDSATVTIDVTNQAPVIDNQTFSVSENAITAAAVGTIVNTGDNDSVMYSITVGNASGVFAINAATGAITIADATLLDFEVTPSYALTVQATDGVNSDTATITIDVTNQAPVIDDQTFSVSENAITAAAVGTIVNTGDNDSVMYSITVGNAAGVFAINAATGAITIADATLLDFEVTPSYALTVQATDGVNSDTATITIDVTNQAPVIDNQTFSVSENAITAAAVGTIVNTGDNDSVMYSITVGNAAGVFAINAATGAITIADATLLDFEVTPSYLLTVQATDGVNSDTATVTIDVTNQAPVIDNQSFSVSENAITAAAVGTIVNTGDNDSVMYSITVGNAAGVFAINAATGAITIANATLLNFEVTPSYLLTVQATDGVNSDTATITINVTDVNDVSPVVTAGQSMTINENLSNASSVLVVLATDDDVTATTFQNWLITGGNTDVDGDSNAAFAINAATGAITVNDSGDLNRELIASFSLLVTVSDGVNTSAAQMVAVNLNDLNEFPVSTPIDNNVSLNTVIENSIIGTLVGVTAFASDADATTNVVSYSLTSNPGGLFAINSATGVVTTAAAINRETVGASVIIEVTATSTDLSTAAASFTIAIGDMNEFMVSTPIDSNVSLNTVVENSIIGTLVGVTAFASDADATTNVVSYSLTSNPGGLFAINSATGVVTTAAAINRETVGASVIIEVTATSTDLSTAAASFTIAIGDMNELMVSTPIDSNVALNTVIENSIIGTLVGVTAFASDADATTNVVSYSLTSNPGGLFAINSATGVVTTAAAINRETVGASVIITVLATSTDTSTASQNFAIAIGDMDEFNVSTPVDTDATLNAVIENADIGTTVGITAFASDADATTNVVTYSLSNSAGGLFAIDSMTGVVTVAGAIDFESVGTSLSITVLATSADTSTASQTFAIAIGNVVESDVIVTLPTSGGPFRVLVDGAGLLHVRRNNGAEIITPVSFTDTASITINGSTAGDIVVLDASLSGFEGAFVFNGGNGGDRVDASLVDFAVTFNGEAGNDTLFGGSGNDVFLGGAGNDHAAGNGGNDLLEGEAGNDRLDGGSDDDVIGGGLGNDHATGGDGNDQLFGDAGNDQLEGGRGEDTVTGGLGNDRLVGGTDSDDSSDLLMESVSGISELSDRKLTGAGMDSHTGFERFLLTGSAGSDTISASTILVAVTLIGGAGSDKLTGGHAGDVLQGGDGNDSLIGGEGGDQLEGDAQDDVLTGGFGDDSLNGGEGRDRLTETANADFTLTDTSLSDVGTDSSLTGGTGTDELLDVETVSLIGGNSANTIDASGFTLGGVTLLGSRGNDTLRGGASSDWLDGGSGDDSLEGGAGNDWLIGQAGDDELQGGDDNDTLSGGLGNDILAGGSGTDRLVETGNVHMTLTASTFTGFGTDSVSDLEEAILTGGSSANSINASEFGGTSVTLIGGAGKDLLQGGSGADFLDGGADNDTLEGNDGNDTFTGGAGNDSLVGGADMDLLIEAANVHFTLTNTSLIGVGTDSLTDIENVQLTGGKNGNRINAGDFSLGSVTLIGGAGNDTLIGGTFSDSLDGGIGNDFLTGREGDDVLLGGEGNDTLSGGAGNDHLLGGNGDDRLIGGFGDDAITGEDGNDKALGGQGGPARGGNSSADFGDVITAELIDEAFATIFVLE